MKTILFQDSSCRVALHRGNFRKPPLLHELGHVHQYLSFPIYEIVVIIVHSHRVVGGINELICVKKLD